VIEAVLRQLELWQAMGFEMTVSVNVGARHLMQADFVSRLREALAAHPAVKPSCLELEILESSAMDNLDHVSRVLEECRKMGVKFVLDDFGTGYSSLTYLKQLPVSQIKIDKSFVRDMPQDADNLIILLAVLGMAKAFDLEVIAEGVETVEHGVLLLQLGCELAQGYGIARPLDGAELPAWVKTWRPDPAWVNLSALQQQNLPLLFASIEHKAWVNAIEAFLRGDRPSAPSIDHQACRFGNWLQTQGRAFLAANPAMQRVDALHRELHMLAAQVLELRDAGQNTQALARMPELQVASDKFLDQLKTLL